MRFAVLGAGAIGERLRPGAVVVPAQNGLPWWYLQGQDGPLAGRTLESVDPGGVISRSIATERIVGCVVYCSTEIVEPGVIRHIEGTRFTIGRPDGVATEGAAARSPRRWSRPGSSARSTSSCAARSG